MQKKKEYTTPQLQTYGTVTDLTKQGTSSSAVPNTIRSGPLGGRP